MCFMMSVQGNTCRNIALGDVALEVVCLFTELKESYTIKPPPLEVQSGITGQDELGLAG